MRYYPDHAGLATALLYLGAAQTFRKKIKINEPPSLQIFAAQQ
jgi:hypothetical protein